MLSTMDDMANINSFSLTMKSGNRIVTLPRRLSRKNHEGVCEQLLAALDELYNGNAVCRVKTRVGCKATRPRLPWFHRQVHVWQRSDQGTIQPAHEQ